MVMCKRADEPLIDGSAARSDQNTVIFTATNQNKFKTNQEFLPQSFLQEHFYTGVSLDI